MYVAQTNIWICLFLYLKGKISESFKKATCNSVIIGISDDANKNIRAL